MILPLDKLIDREDNIYALTVAAIKRANQLTVTADEELDFNNGKVVSTAVKQILDKTVDFRNEK